MWMDPSHLRKLFGGPHFWCKVFLPVPAFMAPFKQIRGHFREIEAWRKCTSWYFLWYIIHVHTCVAMVMVYTQIPVLDRVVWLLFLNKCYKHIELYPLCIEHYQLEKKLFTLSEWIHLKIWCILTHDLMANIRNKCS